MSCVKGVVPYRHNYTSPQCAPCWDKKLILCSLVKRKEEWQRAEEERISSLPDPSVPSGHTVMPDRERRETLNALQEGINSY